MTGKQYKQKIWATQKVLAFMGSLMTRYSAQGMRRLWDKMDNAIGTFGLVYVADMIENKRDSTELALIREVVES